ncbi:MAG: hypothetical protein ACHRXM_32175 [Isosphaerales bacterium]
MKRFLLLLVLVMLVFWIMARHRAVHIRPAGPARHGDSPRYARHGDAKWRLPATVRQQRRQALDEARQALDQARDEVRHAFDEARDEVHQAFDEVRGSLASNDDPPHSPPPAPPPPPSAREEAEGLPVPIVPGTRVSEAQAQPPAQPRPVIAIQHKAPPGPNAPAAVASAAPVSSASHTVTGLISATEERAKAEARRKLQENVVNWLDPQVPASWTPPPRLLDAMVLETRIKPIVKDHGALKDTILYEAELKFDASPERRAQLVEVYNRELVERRLITLGGSLAFVLVCLGAVSGYIRTDEATKGYYTNRLRMLAAAGIGAAGVILYHMVA